MRRLFFLPLLLLSVVRTNAQVLTLEQAVMQAREHAPTARIAARQVDEASARAAQARAAFFPMLRLASGYTASNNAVSNFMFALNQGQFRLAGDLNHPGTVDNFQASAQVGLNLFNGGRDIANARAASAAVRGADWSRQVVENDVTLGVTQSYLA